MRFIFNAVHVLGNKQSEPYQAYKRLIADAKFHSLHLEVLEGRIVPRHYGMWLMDTGNWAGKVLLSITDYCGVSWNDLQSTKWNNPGTRQKIGRTLELMHDVGIKHGELGGDMRHVLLDVYDPELKPADLSTGKVVCYITGFSAAKTHNCARKLPVAPLDAWAFGVQVNCREIHQILHHLDYMPFIKPNDASLVTRAIEWHEQYTKDHPDERDVDILIAQRAQLFPDCGQVYLGTRVTFVPGLPGTMDRVCVSDIPDSSDEETD
ncbi:hypothetical protein FB45DRAFT_887450 [Roridomyces roridus]|uniref:Protein kinase domain-containing protein n=1 Tax=Roridomyces roridus TaxID=1738132 RepID=A0AAD7CIU1_9AGAR|nr:hypothetical protein FB45DRAFT_887450 [Roridomyces roridus]